MPKTFLGKNIPEPKRPNPPRKMKASLFGLMVLPVVLAGGLLSLQKGTLTSETGPRTTGGALGRSLQAIEDERLASNDAAAGAAAGALAGSNANSLVSNPCTREVVSEAFKSVRDSNHKQIALARDVVLFPLIPDGISGYNKEGAHISTMDNQQDIDKVCTQPFWGREVVYWFVYKALAILNWLATAVAILLTLYAAILYITGFANEGNVKKAKGILIGAYIGLAIVFLAKILVFGAVNVVSGEDPRNVAPPIDLNV